MKRRFHIKHLAALTVLLSVCGTASAQGGNALKQAWNCAKDTAVMTYDMASKGTKAVEVLGTSPQCVALALAPDVPMIAMTGAMVAINAVDSSLLPAQGCEQALKTTAAMPVAKLLNEIAPSGSMANLLKGELNAQVQEQIWSLLNTPPLDQFTQRASCGCVFLEAGVTVETVKDIIQSVGKAGKSCDKFLDNVPGYTPIKNAAKEGAYQLNNLGEDILTSQAPHMPVPQYFEKEYEGYPNSWRVQSHAVAKALNPAHNSRTQDGARVIANQYFAADGNGAASGSRLFSGCKAYFDGHKMSEKNAEKTCNALSEQFDSYYQQFVPVMVARDKAIKALIPGLSAIRAKGEQQCDQLYATATDVQDKPNSILGCKNSMRDLEGRIDYPNPYDVTGSLGTPIPKETVDGWLKGKSKNYFLLPEKAFGMYAKAYDILASSAANPDRAVKFTLAAYQLAVDGEIARRKKKMDGERKAALDAKQKSFQQAVGSVWADKCPTTPGLKTACTGRLMLAWEQCNAQFNNVPCTAETKTKEVCTLDPKWMEQTNKKCQQSYQDTVLGFQNMAKQTSGMASYKSACPASGGDAKQQKAAAQCNSDFADLVERCVGGPPTVTAGYFQNGKLSRSPEPLASCAGAQAYFSRKWAADDQHIGQVNAMYSTAAQSCIKLGLPGCQEEVSKKTDACREQIHKDALALVAPAPLESAALTAGLNLLGQRALACVEALRKTPEKFSKGKEVQALAIQQYTSQCPGRSTTKNWAKLCTDEIIAAAQECSVPAGPARAGGAPSPQQQLDACKPKLQAIVDRYKKEAAGGGAPSAVANPGAAVGPVGAAPVVIAPTGALAAAAAAAKGIGKPAGEQLRDAGCTLQAGGRPTREGGQTYGCKTDVAVKLCESLRKSEPKVVGACVQVK
jgi:hypothetical protein